MIQDQVVRPDGMQGTYATVQTLPDVGVLPLDDEGKVYLTPNSAMHWVLPAWRCAAAGESCEWHDLGLLHLDTSIVYGPVYLFLAQKLSFQQSRREASEVMETVKLPLDEALRKVMESEVTHATCCGLILKAGRWLTETGAKK